MSTIVIEGVCGTAGTTDNMGGKKQCLEAPVRLYALAKSAFSFATTASAVLEASWNTAILAKDVVIFPDIELIELNYTEAEIMNGRYEDFKIKDAIKGVNYTHYLSSCTHESLATFENNAIYTKVFRITDANELLCEVNDDGTVVGEPLKSFLVNLREDTPIDGKPLSKVQMKFGAYGMSILAPAFSLEEYEGVYDVNFEVSGSPSSTEIVVVATTKCSGAEVSGFVVADFVYGGGTLSSSTESPDGTYTFAGTGLTTGALTTDGVILIGENYYEGVSETVTI